VERLIPLLSIGTVITTKQAEKGLKKIRESGVRNKLSSTSWTFQVSSPGKKDPGFTFEEWWASSATPRSGMTRRQQATTPSRVGVQR